MVGGRRGPEWSGSTSSPETGVGSQTTHEVQGGQLRAKGADPLRGQEGQGHEAHLRTGARE